VAAFAFGMAVGLCLSMPVYAASAIAPNALPAGTSEASGSADGPVSRVGDDLSMLQTSPAGATPSATVDMASLHFAPRSDKVTIWVGIGGLAVTLLFGASLLLRMRPIPANTAAESGGNGAKSDCTTTADGSAKANPVETLDHLHARIAELETSKEKLEDFVYLAAHDLKSPLRTVLELSDWLRNDRTNHLSPESRNYLKMLEDRTRRINDLLTGLLHYVAADSTRMDVGAVPVADLVEELAFLLDPERRFEIDVSTSHEVIFTLEVPLRHILMNVIGNAMKHHDRSYGRIGVHAQVDGEICVIEVEDDGPGIAPAQQDRIFEPFVSFEQIGHNDSSGLGLLIVKKLLHRHGGRIDVSSAPKTRRGSIFRITFPLFEDPATLDRGADGRLPAGDTTQNRNILS
jgi:signal transduction histidine kinase